MTNKKNTCPGCGHNLDAAKTLDGNMVEPNEGDLSLCVYCGQLGEYGPNAEITPMREDEVISLLKQHPELAETVNKVRGVFKSLGIKPTKPNLN